MNYYLNVPGKKAEPISFEELRARRAAGQLDGTELVWTDGMSQWQPLNSILSGPNPPPVPKTSPRANRIIITGAILAVVLILGAMGYYAYVTFQRVRAQVQRQTARVRTTSLDKVKIAGKPVASNTNTLTAKEVRARGKEFRVRQYIDAYKEHGDHSSPCDAAAVEFLQAWLDEHYADRPATNGTAAKLGNKLAANPACKDPLVLTIAGAVGNELFEDRRRLELALANYPESKYRAYPKFYATLMLARDVSHDSGRVGALHASALALLKEAFADGSIQPGDQSEVAEIFIGGWGKSFFDAQGHAVCEIVSDAGKPFQWLGYTLKGENYINLAWQARGGGYANTVTESGWQAFGRNLNAARASFTAAWKLQPDQPLPACRMITVEMGDEGLQEMRLWFDRAVAAQIDVPEAWHNFEWGLRPRWHGSLDAMRAFGVMAVNTKRFDTDVPRKYFDVVKDLESELETPSGQHIYGRPDLWPYFQQMYEGYIAEPAQKQFVDGWRNSYCVVAYFARQYGIARQQLEALNWKLSRLPTGWGRDLSLMALEVAARTGPESNAVALAETAYGRKDTARALKVFEPLRTAADDRTAAFARARSAALEAEQQLAKGEWINLLPQKADDPNWVISFGRMKCLPGGGIEVQSGSRGHMMYSRTRLPADFEVEGEFEVVRSSNKSFQTGLVIGYPDLDDSTWYGFRMKRNPHEHEIAAFANGWSGKQVYGPVKLDDKTNSFTFKFQHGAATASVNGQEVLHSATLKSRPEAPDDQMFLGVGAYVDANETVVRYRNVRVRKL